MKQGRRPAGLLIGTSRGADFSLFRRLVERVPWEAVLRGKGIQEGWTLFRKEIVRHRTRLSPCTKRQAGGEADWPT